MKIERGSLEPIDFEGLQIRDFTADTVTSSSVAEIKVPGGAVHRRAWSKRSEKYYYIVRGGLSFRLGDEDLVLVEGDCCIVPQGTRFNYRNDSENEAIILLVHTPSFDLSQEVFEDTP